MCIRYIEEFMNINDLQKKKISQYQGAKPNRELDKGIRNKCSQKTKKCHILIADSSNKYIKHASFMCLYIYL